MKLNTIKIRMVVNTYISSSRKLRVIQILNERKKLNRICIFEKRLLVIAKGGKMAIQHNVVVPIPFSYIHFLTWSF